MKVGFDELKRSHEKLREQKSWLGEMSLQEFAQTLQENDKENDYSAGFSPDNLAGKVSRGIDKVYDVTGLPTLSSNIVGGAGKIVDNVIGDSNQRFENTGAELGKSLPRSAVNSGLALGGAALMATGGGAPLGAGMIAVGAADAGLQGYESSGGSLKQAATDAILTGATGPLSKVGGKLGAKLLPKSLLNNAAAQGVAGSIATEGLFLGTDIANAAINQGIGEAFTAENLFGSLVGSVAELPAIIKGGVQAGREQQSTNHLNKLNESIYKSHFEKTQKDYIADEIKREEYLKKNFAVIPKFATTKDIRPDYSENYSVNVYDKNDSHQLERWLLGKEDSPIPDKLKASNIEKILQYTGFKKPMLETADLQETLTRREKGKDLVQKSLQYDLGEDRITSLTRKASLLLETPAADLVDLVKRARAVNEFAIELDQSQRSQAIGKNKFGGSITAPEVAVIESQNNRPRSLRKGVSPEVDLNQGGEVKPFDLVTYNKEQEVEQRVNPAYPNRPKSVKGKVIQNPLIDPSKPTPLSDSIDQNPARSKIAKDPLAKYLAPELSLIPSSVTNPNGYITLDGLRQESTQTHRFEDSSELAVSRLNAKVENELRAKIDFSLGKTDSSPIGMMGRVFDKAGLSPELKTRFLDTASRLHQIFGLESKVRYMETEGVVDLPSENSSAFAQMVRGAYFPELKTATVSGLRDGVSGFDLLATQAHESAHGLLNMVKENANLGLDDFRLEHTRRAQGFANELDVGQRERILLDGYKELMDSKLLEDGKYKEWVKYASQNADEFLTEYSAMVAMSKTSLAKKQSLMRLLPEPISNFVRMVMRGIHEVRQALFGSGALENLPGGAKGLKEFHQNIEALFEKDRGVEQAKKVVNDTVQMASAFENGDLGGLSVQYAKNVPSRALTERKGMLRKLFEGLVLNVAQHQQMSAGSYWKKVLPSYNEVITGLSSQDSMAVSLQHSMRSDFLIKTSGGLLKELSSVQAKDLSPADLKKLDNMRNVSDTPRLLDGFNKAALALNKAVDLEGQAGLGVVVDYNHQSVQDAVKHLSPAERASIKEVFDAFLKQNATAGLLNLEVENRRLVQIYASYLLGAGVRHEDALDLAKQFRNAQRTGGMLPPALLSVPGAETIQKHWTRVEPDYAKLESKYTRPYLTEFRTGRFGVRFEHTVDGVTVSDYRAANDVLSQKAIIREIESEGGIVTEIIDKRDSPDQLFGGLRETGLHEAASLVRAHQQAMIENGNPLLADLLAEFDAAQPLIEKIDNMAGTDAKRNFAPSRDKINMLEAQQAYSSLTARKVANEMIKLETHWLLQHPDWQKHPKLYEEVKQFRQNVLSAGRQAFQGFRKATTFMTMGANVSSAVMEATQMVTMGMWRAVENVGVKNALSYTAEAYREAFIPLDKMKNQEFKNILVMATNQGRLKTGGNLDNFFNPDDVVNFNVIKAGDRRDMVDVRKWTSDREFLAHKAFEKIGEFANKGFEVGMMPTRMSSLVNNRGALYVGYKMAKEKGLTNPSDIYNYAVNHMQVTNIHGGRAAHSSFKLKAGQANKFVEAATLMTNYPIAMFSQMYSSFSSAMDKTSLTKAERIKAAQAFGGQLLVQFGLAGIGGLGVNALFGVAKEMFGLDVENEIREGLLAIDESGTLGEVLINGALNTLTGYDFASRFDLSGIGGFNQMTGFEARGLFGAGGGLITALYNAPGQIANGNLSKVQLVPSSLRRLLDSEDSFRDYTGRQIIDPTTSEQFMNLIGFRSVRMSRAYEQNRAAKEQSLKNSEQKRQRMNDLSKLLEQDKGAEVFRSLQTQAVEDLTEEGIDVKTDEGKKKLQTETNKNLLALVNHIVRQSSPLDPLEEASTGVTRAQVGSAIGVGRNSEEAQLLSKAELIRKISGQLPKNLPKSVMEARVIDALIRQNPNLTVREARALLKKG